MRRPNRKFETTTPMHVTSRKLLFLVTAAVEAATGLCLLVVPAVLLAVLLGFQAEAVETSLVGRIAGAALVAIAIRELGGRKPSVRAFTARIGHRHSSLQRRRIDAARLRRSCPEHDRYPALACGSTSHTSCDLVPPLPASKWSPLSPGSAARAAGPPSLSYVIEQ